MSTERHDDLMAIKHRLDEGAMRMDSIEQQLASNTAITVDIKDLLDAARLGLRVLGWVGVAAKWCTVVAAAGAAVWGLLHQGTPK